MSLTGDAGQMYQNLSNNFMEALRELINEAS